MDKKERDELRARLEQQQAQWAQRAEAAQAQAAPAYARLLKLADGDTGQAGRAAQFLAATFNGAAYPFDLFDLRALDVPISDDMLVCLDALRWGKTDLHKLVPKGESKVQAVIRAWDIKPAGWL